MKIIRLDPRFERFWESYIALGQAEVGREIARRQRLANVERAYDALLPSRGAIPEHLVDENATGDLVIIIGAGNGLAAALTSESEPDPLKEPQSERVGACFCST